MPVINDSYKTGLKREIVTALKPLFGNNFPIAEYQNKVYVGLEYPWEQVQYPAIYITYNEQQIRNIGVGHIEEGRNEDGTPYIMKHWFFQGTINFNIMTLSPIDRDRLSAAMINILAFGNAIPQFAGAIEELMDNDYIDLQINAENITPGGEQVGDVPWGNPDENVFGASYSVPVIGEFYSNPWDGGLIEISKVIVDPYREGQAAPW